MENDKKRILIFTGPASGAQAAYEMFNVQYGAKGNPPWDKLSIQQQRRWIHILAAGMRKAIASDEDGVAKYLAGELTITEMTGEDTP